MQIVVPAAGNGSRFAQKGYLEPKPLIKVLGKALVQWSTSGLAGAQDAKYIFLVRQEHIEQNRIDSRLLAWYPNSVIVPVYETTEGQACTALLARGYLDLEDELAIVNCDNLFAIDLPRAKRELEITEKSRGIVFYIAGNNPAWSYVATDESGQAMKVAEKQVISDKATVGCYYFLKARYFVEGADEMIARNIRFNNEFYVSPIYNVFIDNGEVVHTWPCDFHFSLGTPDEMDRFSKLFVWNESKEPSDANI